MKKFFQKLKMDAKFANAGVGHKLTDDTRTYFPPPNQSQPPIRTRPMSSSQAQAGAAALARYEEKSKQTKVVKPTVINSKMRSQENFNKPTEEKNSTEKEQDINSQTIESSVLFYSPFTDEIVSKSNLKNHMREQLLLRLAEHPVEVSSLMIQTLNLNPEKKANAINLLNRYIDNIINNPGDEKFLKIRKSNKVFSEKVAPVEGTEEFLEAIGFKKRAIEHEVFFVMNAANVEKLTEAKDALASVEALEFRIYRDAKILLPSSTNLPKFKISDDFYKLSSSEIKKEQERRTEEVELNKQLRTKAMRDAGKTTSKFNYTVIRIRFPDERLLQGTFRAHETIEALKDFIRQHINVDWAVFFLKTSLGECIDNDSATLISYKLVPSALLYLTWNEEIRREILTKQGIDLALQSR